MSCQMHNDNSSQKNEKSDHVRGLLRILSLLSLLVNEEPKKQATF